MFRILAIAGALLGLASVAQADVWRWTDPNGTIHYSDNWVPGSTLVKTDSRSTYSGAPTSSAPAANSTTNPPATPTDAALLLPRPWSLLHSIDPRRATTTGKPNREASDPLILTFANVSAATGSECWNRTTGAQWTGHEMLAYGAAKQ